MASVKINISVNPELLERMDIYSKNNAISRSGLISLAVSQYLNSIEMQPKVKQLMNQLTAAFDGALKGNLSEDEKKEVYNRMQSSYAEIEKKSF